MFILRFLKPITEGALGLANTVMKKGLKLPVGSPTQACRQLMFPGPWEK